MGERTGVRAPLPLGRDVRVAALTIGNAGGVELTLNGKPVAGATVTFVPEKGKAVTGVTDANGRFVVGGDVPAGRYKVTVGGAGVPAKYAGADTSALQVEVPAEGASSINFDLKVP